MAGKRSKLGRGVFYTRDSGGKHDQTPAEYVDWATRRCDQLGVVFNGTADEIERMIRARIPVSGDLFLDYCVKGDTMDRVALPELRRQIAADRTISHLFIPKRDRLARPDEATTAVQLENDIRRQGVNIIYISQDLAPLALGERPDIGQTIASVVAFDQAGRFLDELASTMVSAKLRLAKRGVSTGGRAPYGFCRTLIDAAGTVVRRLDDGEVVRKAGHHVALLPDEKFAVVRRILRMLETMPALRVAATLTAEGVPTPDSGRRRRDGGVLPLVTGVWHANTVTNIARNTLLLGVKCFGRRSMGKKRRTTPNGPRALEEGDFCRGHKPKAIINPPENVISAPAAGGGVHVDPTRHAALLARLNERGATQRGKPRARDPGKNPLGGRIFDMNCCGPMYRTPRKYSFRYECGLYQQSKGALCSYNHVDGPKAANYAFATIRQSILASGQTNRLERIIRTKLAVQATADPSQEERAAVETQLTVVDSELKLIRKNLARAKDDEQYLAISAQFDELNGRQRALTKRHGELCQQRPDVDIDAIAEKALKQLADVASLVDQAKDLPGLTQLFSAVNLQMFLRFVPVQKKKRLENHLAGGVITWGSAQPPIEKYAGPTGRRAIKDLLTCQYGELEQSDESFSADGRNESLGNVSRGDRS